MRQAGEYVVPYQQDLSAALDALRRQVFASGDFIKPSYYGAVFDLPEPGSVDDLFEQEQYWEFMGTSGTHSIIDVVNVVPVDDAMQFFIEGEVMAETNSQFEPGWKEHRPEWGNEPRSSPRRTDRAAYAIAERAAACRCDTPHPRWSGYRRQASRIP